MKIATFNIDGVNKRVDNLIAWLAASKPDVVCLQELKAEHGAFPLAQIEAAGYGAAWLGQRTWNGVAILARNGSPVVTRKRLPGDQNDLQARYLEAAVDGILVASIYLPNGNPSPGPKFDYKLAWFERLIEHAMSLISAGVPVVLAGDYNVVPTEADICQPNSWLVDALTSPEARTLSRVCCNKAGLTRWTLATRLLRNGPIGRIFAIAGRRTKVFASIVFCCRLISPTI